MRPTIVLLPDRRCASELRNRIRSAGSYVPGEVFDQLSLGDCCFGVDFSGRVLNDFEEEELAELTARLGQFEAVLVEYSGASCVRTLLERVLPGLTGVLDTNFWELLDFDEVLDRFRRDPGWEWRRN